MTPAILREIPRKNQQTNKFKTEAGWPTQLAREMTEMALRAVHVQDEDTPGANHMPMNHELKVIESAHHGQLTSNG